MTVFERNSVPIYGVLGFMRLMVTTSNPRRDEQLLGYARELHRKLEDEIRGYVKETLGPEFELERVEVRSGSIDIYIFITAVGTFFMSFSQYESFIKSMNLLVSQRYCSGFSERLLAPQTCRHRSPEHGNQAPSSSLRIRRYAHHQASTPASLC
jgi:hypothetical protein